MTSEQNISWKAQKSQYFKNKFEYVHNWYPKHLIIFEMNLNNHHSPFFSILGKLLNQFCKHISASLIEWSPIWNPGAWLNEKGQLVLLLKTSWVINWSIKFNSRLLLLQPLSIQATGNLEKICFIAIITQMYIVHPTQNIIKSDKMK